MIDFAIKISREKKKNKQLKMLNEQFGCLINRPIHQKPILHVMSDVATIKYPRSHLAWCCGGDGCYFYFQQEGGGLEN